jgi:hypothetical protein
MLVFHRARALILCYGVVIVQALLAADGAAAV